MAGDDIRVQPSQAEVDENKWTILIYSPDLNFCFSLSMLFQDRYNVITTTNLGLLDKFVGTYSADLVIIDAIPSKKILGRLEGLRGVKSDLPIIMLYVYNSKEVELDTAIRKHVDSVFYKPFEIDSVSERIGSLLNG